VEVVPASGLLTGDALEFLTQWEASNNVLLGYARRGEDPQMPTKFMVLRDESESGAACGAAMRTEGFPVLLAVPTSVEAALAVEAHFADEVLRGVNGPEEASAAFFKARAERDGALTWEAGHRMICYETSPTSLQTVALRPDETVRCLSGDSAADLALVKELIDDFSKAVGSRVAGEFAQRRLEQGTAKFLVLQHGDDVCSLVASARSTPRYAVITSVYTLPSWRRKGCASRAVSAMATRLLEDKERAALFADANKEGPNKLYVSLGFAPINTMQVWEPPGSSL